MIAKAGTAAFGAALGICLFAASGNAATITSNFSFFDSSNTVIADGSFKYDSSHSGQLSYADLSAFTINMVFAGQSYDLAFVNSVSNYVYFGYDTTTNSFVSQTLSGTVGGGFESILSATNDSLTEGFFLDPLVIMGVPNGFMEEYRTATLAQATSYTVSQTPIPAALPLFASALGGLGIFGWYRRKSA